MDILLVGLLVALGIFVAAFTVVLVMDFIKNRNNLENKSTITAAIIGFVTDFFDTLGIGSFAPTTALIRATKQTDDALIPGTLNVAHAIPVALEAFIFIKAVEVDPLTLVLLLLSATLGAWIGAGIISKLPEIRIQLVMGVTLALTALIMIASNVGLIQGSGTAIGLTGVKLIIGIVGNFILGALMTAGVGLYAPCMALVYFLGMSPSVAFPIMMGSCAFLMQVAGIRFVREGRYAIKTSFTINIAGCVGVLIAAFLVTSLPIDILKWLVVVVVIYTSVTMLIAVNKKRQARA